MKQTPATPREAFRLVGHWEAGEASQDFSGRHFISGVCDTGKVLRSCVGASSGPSMF